MLEWLIIVGPMVLISIVAQIRVRGNFSKYHDIPNASGLTGAEIARKILDAYNLHHVEVKQSSGFISDHYDPISRSLGLSEANFNGTSITAAGVAAHEAGHAIQHAKNYGPIELRNNVVPLAGVSSYIAMPMLVIGFLFYISWLIWLGIIVYGFFVLLQLLNLPVEYDASRRAKQVLLHLNLASRADREGVEKVLNAAAFTYVASTLTAISYLVLFILGLRR